MVNIMILRDLGVPKRTFAEHGAARLPQAPPGATHLILTAIDTCHFAVLDGTRGPGGATTPFAFPNYAS